MAACGDKRAYRESSVYLYIINDSTGATETYLAHQLPDKYAVWADGVVAEQGVPDELYKKNGIYTHMVDLQSASGKWKIK